MTGAQYSAAPAGPEEESSENAAEILEFWEAARSSAHLDDLGPVTGHSGLGSVPPPAWSFGQTRDVAEAELAAVLAGRKTATSSAVAEYDDEDAPLPRVGELSIVLDADGHPRALIRTTSVQIVAFGQVDAQFAEDEDNGTLEGWRTTHREYLTRLLGDRFAEDLELVCERFEVRYPR